MTVPVAFYGFQRAPEVGVVTEDRRWQGWFEDKAGPLIDQGIRDHHLHNPFGLHQVARNGRVMHIDQFELSYCGGWLWLADRDGFAQVVADVHERGGTVQAYVGSPLVVGRSPQDTFLPKCSPGSRTLSVQLRLFRRTGVCKSPLMGGCLCWDRLVRFHLDPLVDAGVDAIGFDASFDFHPGDCMDRLVQSLLARNIEVMIEPWPRRLRKDSPLARPYPPVSWIIRELLYQRIQLNPKLVEAPLESVKGRIYRIVPDDTKEAGRIELAEINVIRANHGEPEFGGSQEIVDVVREDGHIPMVRAGQLASGAVT